MNTTTQFDNSLIVIVGLGLIGGSIALGLRKSVPGIQIIGVDISPHNRFAAQHCCDALFAELGDLPPDFCTPKMVILATPVLQYPLLATICNQLFLSENTTITDVGSVKGLLFDSFAQAYGGKVPKQLIGGHPIAGAEQSGFAAASAELFIEKKFVIVTDEKPLNCKHYQRVIHLWQDLLQANDVSHMNITRHDNVFAHTSHLPHLLSFALVHFMGEQVNHHDLFSYVGAGFRDFTRIASSDPTMWSNVTKANQQAIATTLDGFISELYGLRTILTQNASHIEHYIHQYLRKAKHLRDTHVLHIQSTMSSNLVAYPLAKKIGLCGKVTIPGDKSISHRSIMFGALAQGVSRIHNLLDGEDNLATIEAFRQMGVHIEGPERGEVHIHGVGLHGLQPPAEPLYMGNSGTAMRLLCGLLVGQTFASRLTGDESLSSRPMWRIIEPLRAMGANISAHDNMLAPLDIMPTKGLHAIDYRLPMASAQVKSALLLAGLYCKNTTKISEPLPTRDHSERLLTNMGVTIHQHDNTITLSPPSNNLVAGDWRIPADFSSAAFFIVAGCIIPGSKLILEGIGVNPTRTGLLAILERMGANIQLHNQRVIGNEPVADITMQSSTLQATKIDERDMALSIDEFPALCIAAACAQGETVISGAKELRVKETDRIAAMVEGLTTLGIEVRALPDGARIVGGKFKGGEIDSFGDHRIAMAFAIAGAVASHPIVIKNCANIATSFPDFVTCTLQAGLRIQNG